MYERELNLFNDMKQQLAESQAREAVLRYLLENHAGNYKLTKVEGKEISDALTTPTDNTALLAAVRAGKLEVLNWVKDTAYLCGDTVTVRELLVARILELEAEQ